MGRKVVSFGVSSTIVGVDGAVGVCHFYVRYDIEPWLLIRTNLLYPHRASMFLSVLLVQHLCLPLYCSQHVRHCPFFVPRPGLLSHPLKPSLTTCPRTKS